ncbi:MAG: TetR/AcrR family transcriptional regulator [Alphaproteobacteria bacterium]|nr:TetR/AcrR family transcriptional regulator [Alphaproteobacteria bacterium]MDP7183250.1 TetR/AcrR family transcriptional regulator [Alphaproteobacteria bacterium]HJO88381.1 TetR/AcrR family transcriptional regulator [Alphaproteobacteria bacterium]
MNTEQAEPSKQPSKGTQTRQALVTAASELASLEGLEGLSLSRLAQHAGMSKSGLYAHFGSKEALQLAAIEGAHDTIKRELTGPVRQAPPGFRRLWAFIEGYISYIERKVFPGGCFFKDVAAEFDSRPGPVRDRIAEIYPALMGISAEAAKEARELGELDENTDPKQLGFEIVALIREAERLYVLENDPKHIERAWRGIVDRLSALATEKTPPLLHTTATQEITS